MKGVLIPFIIALAIRAVLPIGTLLQSEVTKNVIDEGLVEQKYDLLPKLIIALLAIQLIRSVTSYILRIVLHNSSQTMLFGVRKKLYESIQRQDMEFFKKYPTGELMSRLSSDLDWMRYSVSFFLPNILDALITFVSTLNSLVRVERKSSHA